jgi:transcriptional regulator with XRE-family HTH domain
MLVEERNKSGLTQPELAQKLGRSQSYVSRYESGERRLYYFDVLEIADALGFDAGSFTRRLAENSKFMRTRNRLMR